jgi:hypothetical protein
MYRGWWALGAGKPGSGAAGPGKARGLRKKGVDLGTAGSRKKRMDGQRRVTIVQAGLIHGSTQPKERRERGVAGVTGTGATVWRVPEGGGESRQRGPEAEGSRRGRAQTPMRAGRA